MLIKQAKRELLYKKEKIIELIKETASPQEHFRLASEVNNINIAIRELDKLEEKCVDR